MADTPVEMVPIHIPADLFAKIEKLKMNRERDRERTVEELVRGMCETYIALRESQEWEAAHREELEKSYADNPNDWDDAEIWKETPGPKEQPQ